MILELSRLKLWSWSSFGASLDHLYLACRSCQYSFLYVLKIFCFMVITRFYRNKWVIPDTSRFGSGTIWPQSVNKKYAGVNGKLFLGSMDTGIKGHDGHRYQEIHFHKLYRHYALSLL
jgi:hypothetical protein